MEFGTGVGNADSGIDFDIAFAYASALIICPDWINLPTFSRLI
jgi:hypothetical protein